MNVNSTPLKLSLNFQAIGEDDCAIALEAEATGEAKGHFHPPFEAATERAMRRALEPGPFRLERFSDEERQALEAAGVLKDGRFHRLHETIGEGLYSALAADEPVRAALDTMLSLARQERHPLHAELRFGPGAERPAALPWELLREKDAFLVRDNLLALSRYPEGAIPPTRAEGDLPLRVLLCISRPAGAVPLDPIAERRALLHGLRSLEEQAAVVVDVMRPPTFETLIEAVRGGDYHVLHFDGHGVFGARCQSCGALNAPEMAECGRCKGPLPPPKGYLLFEDEYGGESRVAADELAPILYDSQVRLAVLSACQSAAVGGDVWAGAAPALLRSGVPLAVGMQVSVPAKAAVEFARQFYLALARGEPLPKAVSEGRLPLIQQKYGHAWFIPTLYGRTVAGYALFDSERAVKHLEEQPEQEERRNKLRELRATLDDLGSRVGGVGGLHRLEEIASLRRLRGEVLELQRDLTRREPGTWAAVVSPLYGVPANPYFVGRAEELRQVGEALEGKQHVVVWGAAGIGKTALAIEVAHRQSWRFPGGALWLSCQGGTPFDTLLNTMGAFCGIDLSQEDPAQKPSRVRALLAMLSGECLVVWDNYEDVMEDAEVARFVRDLPPNCRSLVTSRVDPEILGWRVVRLGGLAAGDMAFLFLLLVEDVGGQVVTQGDAGAIEPMVDFLEGHPLALTLIAPLTARRRLSRLWAELQKQPLKGVEASLNLSCDALSEELKALFARLSVFAIAFEEEAAEALGGTIGELEQLVRRALVRFDGVRYGYHPLVRQYAYKQLENPQQVERLAAEYLQGKLTSEKGGTPDEALEECDLWERAGEWEEFAKWAHALMESGLHRQGYWGEIMARLERAQVAVAEHLDDARLEAMLLNDMGIIAEKRGQWERAIEFYQQAIKVNEKMGNIRGLAATWTNLGNVYQLMGQWERAIEFHQKAGKGLEKVGDLHGLAITWNNLGEVYRRKGKWEQAIEFYQQAIEGYEKVDDIHGLAKAWDNLGSVYMQQGQWERAIEFHQKAGKSLEKVGDLHGLAITWKNLGEVYRMKSQWEQAIEFYQKAIEVSEQMGDLHGLAQIWHGLGQVCTDKGQWERAIGFYQKAIEVYEEASDLHGLARTWGNLSSVYIQQGQWEQAIEFLQKAIEIMEEAGDIHSLSTSYMNLGIVYMQQGQWEQAIGFYQQAIKVKRKVGDIHGLGTTYINLGSVYMQQGQWERAIEFYQQASEVMEQVGDIHGLAQIWGNLGVLYNAQGDKEQAARCLAQALLVFAQLGADHLVQQTGGNLVRVLGSSQAAQQYWEKFLEEMAGQQEGQAASQEAPTSQPPGGSQDSRPMETVPCSGCGHPNSADALRCRSCGRRFG